MAVRQGTGKVIKFFMDKSRGDNISGMNAEVAELTDKDLAQLTKGIEDGTLTY